MFIIDEVCLSFIKALKLFSMKFDLCDTIIIL